MEVADGVWQLKIPMRFNPLGYTSSYLLVDASTLIDTGVGTKMARSALDEQLKSLGLETSDIERVIITHLHRDHIGLVSYISSNSGAKVYAHENARKVLRNRAIKGRDRYDKARSDLKALGGGAFIRILNRFSDTFRHAPPSIPIDKTVADGDLIRLDGYQLRAIWTPGHSPNHICLYDEDRRILFSGDHILPGITSHVSLHTYEDADPLADYINSLEKLRGLPVDLVLPSHEHVFRDLEKRIDKLKHHHDKRCSEILKTISKGEKTAFQISAHISWDSDPWTRMSFWTKRMAAEETLAHLVYLRNRGMFEERDVKGVLYYRIHA